MTFASAARHAVSDCVAGNAEAGRVNTNGLRVVSVLPLLGHPRHSKRIAMLKQGGFTVEALALERDYHDGRRPDCPVQSLGKIVRRRGLRRILKLAAVLPAVRRAMKRNRIVYAFGLEMAFVTLMAGVGLRKPIVLEIGDIRQPQVAPGWKGRLVRMLDRQTSKFWSLIVATTPAFVETYYRQWLKVRVPAIVIENKVEPEFAQTVSAEKTAHSLVGRPLVDRPLRIGYFGGLRCEWSWRVLKGLAASRPHDVQIVLAGYPIRPPDVLKQAAEHHNVEYLGQYRSPQGLPALYGSVDLIWGCYQPIGPNDWNLRWARPNRFYESCLFQVPIVSRAGSCDAVDVARYRIGMIVEDEDVDAVIAKLCAITPEDLELWTENMAEVPPNVYMYTTESDDLRAALERIGRERP